MRRVEVRTRLTSASWSTGIATALLIGVIAAGGGQPEQPTPGSDPDAALAQRFCINHAGTRSVARTCMCIAQLRHVTYAYCFSRRKSPTESRTTLAHKKSCLEVVSHHVLDEMPRRPERCCQGCSCNTRMAVTFTSQ